MDTQISSEKRQVIIGDARPTVLIGERINPAGKKKMAEALKAGSLDIVCREAIAQVKAGADIIDICVSTFGIDEVSLLPQAVQAVMEVVDAPLCLDSAKPDALAKALAIYRGKALINSVTGEEKSLQRVLPLVKSHGAAVIGLTQDDKGIPADPDRRTAIAYSIVEKAFAMGIPREDVIIDCLALAVGANANAARVTLETIRKIKIDLGVNITLGASNVSFGLPEREIINNAFVSMALEAGATCLFVDVAKVRPAILAADLLLNQDKRARRYIEHYRRNRAGDS
jgi:5-methyltetrahydrofolate--homocysteine methyltransferase